ncbi:MAG: hypothetical protein L0Y68_03480 [Candidatus Dadabacteria bacterium]|nr:hypothetical protein [Candidatus Dadabacteria bacterium]
MLHFVLRQGGLNGPFDSSTGSELRTGFSPYTSPAMTYLLDFEHVALLIWRPEVRRYIIWHE